MDVALAHATRLVRPAPTVSHKLIAQPSAAANDILDVMLVTAGQIKELSAAVKGRSRHLRNNLVRGVEESRTLVDGALGLDHAKNGSAATDSAPACTCHDEWDHWNRRVDEVTWCECEAVGCDLGTVASCASCEDDCTRQILHADAHCVASNGSHP